VHREDSAAAEGVVDKDRMQWKHTGVAVDTDGHSAADSAHIDAEVAAHVEGAEARMTHTAACDKVEVEVGVEDDEQDAPTGAVLNSDEEVDVGVDEWDDALVAERDVEVVVEADRMYDAEPEGAADNRGRVGAAEGRWS
jgi:hypothetical protein